MGDKSAIQQAIETVKEVRKVMRLQPYERGVISDKLFAKLLALLSGPRPNSPRERSRK